MQAVLLCSAKLAGKRQVRRKNGGTGKTRDRSSSQFICQLELQLLFQPACVRLSFFFTVPCFLFFYSFVFYSFPFFFFFYFSFYRPRFLSFVRNRRPFRLIYFGFYAVIDAASTSFFLGCPVFLPFIRSREPIFPRWILKSIPLSPCAHSSREIS